MEKKNGDPIYSSLYNVSGAFVSEWESSRIGNVAFLDLRQENSIVGRSIGGEKMKEVVEEKRGGSNGERIIIQNSLKRF